LPRAVQRRLCLSASISAIASIARLRTNALLSVSRAAIASENAATVTSNKRTE
jgi:hypothetical protein